MNIMMRFLLVLCLFGTSAQAEILDVQPEDRVLGDEKAPVTIIEYASLSCSHCADFHTDIFPKVDEQYIQAGKVRFIMRSFPTNPPALTGSKLLMCVPEEQYYTFAKVLFSTQSKWAMTLDHEANLKKIALVGGVSEADFDKCMKDKALEERVLNVRRDAESLKIESTPTFYINGQSTRGVESFEKFSKQIDEALVKSVK
ncbi:MAG: DsbA family protein [Alphaproteobacteria bacterium]|nr:MAG: DsbA family protein [Alphaproteobacteria bacterium]